MKTSATLPSYFDDILTEEMGGINISPCCPTVSPECFHFHTQFELGLCLRGRGVFYIHNTVYPFEAGDISMIYPGENHIAQSAHAAPSEWVFITVDVCRLFQLWQDYPLLQQLSVRTPGQGHILSAAENKQILSYLHRIISLRFEDARLPAEKMGQYRALIACILYETEPWVPRGEHSREGGVDTTQFSGNLREIYPAIQYIFSHYTEAIQAEELCACCNLSPVHLRRIFSASMGLSPIAFLHKIRISHACCELSSTEQSVLFIAEQCGYRSLSSFNRQFQKLMHLSPTEYRAVHAKQQENG